MASDPKLMSTLAIVINKRIQLGVTNEADVVDTLAMLMRQRVAQTTPRRRFKLVEAVEVEGSL